MYIVVLTLSQTAVFVPYYGNMPWRKYLTHVLARHMGFPVAENGDVYTHFIGSEGIIFKGNDQRVLLKDILRSRDVIHSMMITDVPTEGMRGNGCLDEPTRAEFFWEPV